MFIEKIVVGMNSANTYLIGEKNGEIAIIDPGAKDDKIIELIEQYNLTPIKIINTHGHFDHIAGNEFLKEKFNLDILIHKNEKDFLINPAKNLSQLSLNEVISPSADELLKDNDKIFVGKYEFKVIHTPGHSPGGIALYNKKEKVLFSGDTIFAMGIGRSDFNSSNQKDLYKSIENLLKLDDDTKVFPGHGKKTTIREFKKIWKRIKS